MIEEDVPKRGLLLMGRTPSLHSEDLPNSEFVPQVSSRGYLGEYNFPHDMHRVEVSLLGQP